MNAFFKRLFCKHEYEFVHNWHGDQIRFHNCNRSLWRCKHCGKEIALPYIIDENTSDGYHTFKELYDFRLVYNAALFNELAARGVRVIKSMRHSDGEKCFNGGWFIVQAELSTGQVSNHYEEKYWNLFKCKEVEKADEWDGHTPKDVLKRLTEFIKMQ